MAASLFYTVNFHTIAYRSSRPANSVRFGAASDGAAASVATELGNWTTGRMTSLQAKKLFNNLLPYPLGTRVSVAALLQDATFGVSRTRVRNLKTTATDADIVAWLTGVVGATGIGATFSALGAPPELLNGNPVASVTGVNITNKY